MPPKKKPAKRPAAAAASDVETVTPPPATKPSIFSVNSSDKFGVSYFCEGNQDYAEVAFHINGVLRDVDLDE